MNAGSPAPEVLHHHRRRMSGRDPHEHGRVATPLELLFDLTFVIAFGLAAAQFAHALAEGHFGAGLAAFTFACFGVCWAWINFSWFASAYDTDDWQYRVTTMVQMVGVLVLALGVPRMFASVEHGEHLDSSIMVLGYVIMRVAMIAQWLRAAKQDPARRRACLTYAAAIAVAQVGWIALIFIPLRLAPAYAATVFFVLVEMAGPMLAERRDGGTPWHAHHIAERYGLIAIIALGEGVVGTVATLSAVVEGQGWSLEAALVGVAGVGLTFGIWWVYWMLPSGPILHLRRERSFLWGYGQMVIVAAIVATGAGLHVAAYYIEHKAHIGALATVATVAAPLSLFLVGVYALYTYLVGAFDRLHGWLLAGTAAVVALALVAAAAGFGMAWSLVILMLAPAVSVVGFEVLGHLHQAQALAREEAGSVH